MSGIHDNLQAGLAEVRRMLDDDAIASFDLKVIGSNVIYYGAPGTGKSHQADLDTKNGKVFKTTFHPDTDYASFVGCYKPSMEGKDIVYKFVPQVFFKAYVWAWTHKTENVFLDIEEINRGNCAQIFGDIFQLLDRNDKGFSKYPINVDSDIAQQLESQLSKTDYLENLNSLYPQLGSQASYDIMAIPGNLSIVATMNTSDQSLFPMDSAFKRLWIWKYVKIDLSDSQKSAKYLIKIGDDYYKWHDFIREVNKRIKKVTSSEDKQLGNYFVTGTVYEDAFKGKVMFYLWSEVCKEEYGTQKDFFRDHFNKDEEFSFSQLFEDNGTELLKGFMKYLGLDPIQNSEDKGNQEG